MTICRACSGEAVKVFEGKVKPRGCDDCVAMTLIKTKGNHFGVMSLESASKLCSCLANGHEGEGSIEPSEKFEGVTQEYNKFHTKEKERQESLVFYQDKKKQEEIEYYQNRIEELKKLDEESEEGVYVGDD